jgi:hypothetical protein
MTTSTALLESPQRVKPSNIGEVPPWEAGCPAVGVTVARRPKADAHSLVVDHTTSNDAGQLVVNASYSPA